MIRGAPGLGWEVYEYKTLEERKPDQFYQRLDLAFSLFLWKLIALSLVALNMVLLFVLITTK